MLLCLGLVIGAALWGWATASGLLISDWKVHRHEAERCLWKYDIPHLNIRWAYGGCGRLSGELTGCKLNLKNIGTALEMYSTDNAGRFPSTLQPLVPNYLKHLPHCPHFGVDTYSEGFASTAQPRDAYTVVCKGEWHRSAGYSANYPQYTSHEGLRER